MAISGSGCRAIGSTIFCSSTLLLVEGAEGGGAGFGAGSAAEAATALAGTGSGGRLWALTQQALMQVRAKMIKALTIARLRMVRRLFRIHGNRRDNLVRWAGAGARP